MEIDSINKIINGDTLTVLRTFPDECIDCVVTSPPYWGLRDYGIEGQIGLEPTFTEYIEHLQQIFDEVYRILKKSGTCWIDMGDTFNGAKSLCNIPHRFAISMTDNGSKSWILRNTIIWHKPSCMPSSAKDRFTVDFEYVFFFTKNRKYYFEQLFEAYKDDEKTAFTKTRYKDGNPRPHAYDIVNNNHLNKWTYHADRGRNKRAVWTIEKDYIGQAVKDYESAGAQNASDVKRRVLKYMKAHPNGSANKRAVWRINPQPFAQAHFAVFPEKLVEPMIQAGCPSAICDMCGKPYEHKYNHSYPGAVERNSAKHNYIKNSGDKFLRASLKCEPSHHNFTRDSKLEYKKCDCNASTHAGIVLDPFVGSGTTCLVARKLGRHYIGIDLQPDYVDMARKRLAEVL